jgi:peptidoglycan/LPS O-acetylase OafA/YrhL
MLELPWLKFIGRISYSLYLWQELFFVMGHDRAGWPLSLLQYAPFSYLAAFTLAIASYYLVERPMIKIGHKLA